MTKFVILFSVNIFSFVFFSFSQQNTWLVSEKKSTQASAFSPNEGVNETEKESFMPSKTSLIQLSLFDAHAPQLSVSSVTIPEKYSYYDSLNIKKLRASAYHIFAHFASSVTKKKIEYREINEAELLDNEEVLAAEYLDEDLFFDDEDSSILMIDDLEFSTHHLPYTSEHVIQQRLKMIEKTIPLTYNDETRLYVDFYSIKIYRKVQEIMKRSSMYFPLFEKILAEYNMPDELKYLAVIESALNPRIRSHAGATGLWQFMPQTGRVFGLTQNHYFDERMNPDRSTRAACEYLAYLYKMFGDWELALAAYNCGPGTIKKAQKRSGRNNFWDIYNFLPSETRSYVPSFIAAMYTFNYREEHNIIVNEKSAYIPSEKVVVSHAIDLKLLAGELNMCFDDLKALNPQLLRNIVPHFAKNYELSIPKNRVKYFLENTEKILLASATNKKSYSYEPIASTKSRKSNKTSNAKTGNLHAVSSGETLGHIAIMYGVSVKKIMEWNDLSNTKLRIGQKLIVGGGKADDTNAMASNKKSSIMLKTSNNTMIPVKIKTMASVGKEKKTSPETTNTKGKIHVVVNGDSLWKIAKKYKTSIEALKKANALTSDKLNKGQKILIK